MPPGSIGVESGLMFLASEDNLLGDISVTHAGTLVSVAHIAGVIDNVPAAA